jgi:hypothetical protein
MQYLFEKDDVVIVDFGRIPGIGNHHNTTLVVVPKGIIPPEQLQRMRAYHRVKVPCGGFEIFTTRKGRRAMRVLPGTGWIFKMFRGDGDRKWNNYFERAPHMAYSQAKATTRGHGCWFELGVYRDPAEKAKELEKEV